MPIINTGNPSYKPNVTILIYGHGGVGKTTVGASAPKPILLDFEGGSKYFGLRGISLDVAPISAWKDVQDAALMKEIRSDKYESVIIDPIGEAMEKLYNDMVEKRQTKLVQPDGQPTMAGWGYLKDNMRRFVKYFRDMDKNLILIAHVDEKADDEGSLKKRPLIRTKLAQELINLVDMVFYMEVVKDSTGESKRILRCQPNSDKFEAKDRTGQLGEIVEPNIQKIIDAIQGNERFAWMKDIEKPLEKFKAELDASTGDDENNAMNPPPAPPTAPAGPVDPVMAGDTVDVPSPAQPDPKPETTPMDDLAEWADPERKEIRELAIMKLDCNPLMGGDVMRAINGHFKTRYATIGAISSTTLKVMIGSLKAKSDKPSNNEKTPQRAD